MRDVEAVLSKYLVAGPWYFGPTLDTASFNNIFILTWTNAKLYITLKNIAEMVPNFCQKVGFGETI